MEATLNADDARQIGSRLELFVDDWLIDRMPGTTLKLHSPRPREVSLVFDRPWEGPVSLPGSIIHDGGRYRMWYAARSAGGASGQGAGSHTAYAESQDGIHWERPNLGLTEIDGSRANNVIAYDTDDTHIGGIDRDGNPGVPADEAYKAVTVRRLEDRSHYIRGFTSADGLSWNVVDRDPLLVAPRDEWPIFDGEAAVFWDTLQQQYVGYFRGWEPARGGVYSELRGGVRSIRRSTSPDFREWSELQFIDMGDSPQEHLYKHTCEPYFRAPHVYLMFPWRFVPGRRFDPAWPDHGISETVFMTSRDGLRFDRRFMEAFIRPGPDPLNWGDRSNMMSRGIVRTGPAELSIYYSEHYRSPTCRTRRATLRLDGFVSVNAPFGGGELVTRPLVFDGNRLVLNYASSVAGGLRVEVQEPDGRPIDGYALEQCAEVFGDEIERTVAWDRGSDLGSLAGRPVRLRFAMKEADLYSIQFRRNDP